MIFQIIVIKLNRTFQSNNNKVAKKRTFENVVPGVRQQNTKGYHDPVPCSGCTFDSCSKMESDRTCLCSRPSPQTPAPA